MQYTSHICGVRVGKLLHDMDHFAAIVLYQHILNPHQTAEYVNLTAHAIVTARLDHLHIKENIRYNQSMLCLVFSGARQNPNAI